MEISLEFEYSADNIQEFACTEMPGFDAFANKLKQGANRWGRDQVIGADELDLTFWNSVYVADNHGFYDNHGYYISFATHCFKELLDISNPKNKGFEATVRLKLKENGVVFITGELDFSELKTDDLKYLSCNIIVETKTALLDRRADFEPDVFSNTDVDGKPIVPLSRMKFLQKSLPDFQKSEYQTPAALNKTYISYGGDAFFFNPAIDPVGTLGIENSYVTNGTGIPGEFSAETQAYTQLPPGYTTAQLREALDRFKILIVAEDTTNLQFDFTKINAFIDETSGVFTRKSFTLVWGTDVITDNESINFIDNETGALNLNNASFSYTIPFLPRGSTVWLYFSVATSNPAPAGGPISTTEIVGATMAVLATGYSTAIDVVLEVVRYEDFFAKGVEQLTRLPLVAPRIQTGEFKDQFTFNKNMCQPGLNKPLNFVFKNEAEDLRLLRLDYQTSQTKIDIASKDDYYPNVDKGFLDTDVPVEIERTFNERAKVNLVTIEFTKYETADDAKNTTESFHTRGQWGLLNEKVENKLEIKINAALDGKFIQKVIKESLRETTATENDNTIIRVDGIPLDPSAKGGFSAVLGLQTVGNVITILNKNPENDIPAVFKWTQPGLTVGQSFNFTYNGVEYHHTVLEIQNTIVRVQATDYIPNFNGSYLITSSFFYTGVDWTNRTIEGFTDISGLSVPERWSNLRFGVGNILALYSSDLNEIMAAYPNGTAKNISFVNNKDFTARYSGGRLIKQGADLPVSEMREKVLDNSVYKTKCKVDFETGIYVLKAMTERNPDNTIGGFFRIRTNAGIKKIHIDDSANVWRGGILEINKGVVRNESDTVVISVVDGVLYIDGAAYVKGINWFEVNSNDEVILFDERNRDIINPTNYEKVSINGVPYNNVVDFVAALENIS